MALETNLNTAPYYDDYDSNKNYYRLLFRPSTAVQARELTQSQTILQNQIEKFAGHIFKDGSIIEGCTLNFDADYNYVKLNDNYANGTSYNINDFLNKKLVSSSNLHAVVVNYVVGFESTSPDLNTLYVKYLNTGTYSNGTPQKVFDSSETLQVKTQSDVLFGNVVVANSSTNAIGKGYAISISEGTLFQKGFFIRVDPQTTIVTKYNNQPNGLSVGFKTSESIVTSDSDETLLDNAQGSPNYNAPGSNRLKLTANLVVRSTDSINANTSTANTSNFFSIVDFESGQPVTINSTPQYNAIGDQIARRTYEESGHYIIDPFELSTTANTTNNNNLVLEVDKGLGYVQGYRVEFLNKRRVDLRKGIDVAYYDNQIVTANYGSYIIVNEFAGVFDIDNVRSIDLHNAVGTRVTVGNYASAPGAPGTKIGTANIRNLVYFSGTPGTPTAQYKLYLFNIRMNTGANFNDVRSVYSIDGANRRGYADLVLESGLAVLKEPTSNILVFNLGKKAVKDLRNAANTNATQFVYRTQKYINFQSNGTATFTPDTAHAGGVESIFATGSLSETNESTFILVANNSANSANITGTVSTTNTSNTVTGVGTTFTTEFAVGDRIAIGNSTSFVVGSVTNITNATSLTLANTAGTTYTAVNACLHYPAGGLISLSRDDSANVVVATDGSSASINLSKPLANTLTATVYYNIRRSSSNPALITINKNRYVKIDAANNAANTVGPWCLGLPNGYKLRAVYQGTTYSESNPELSSKFTLNNGQKDSHYDLSYLTIKPGSGHTVSASDKLLVVFDHTTYNDTSGVGFTAVSSYPIDDANTANATAITTQEIPLFVSPSTNELYDLRDCIDVRMYVANTANSSTTAAGATTNPANTTTFNVPATGAHNLLPDSNFNTNFSYYLGRKDKIALSPQGKLVIIEGAPAVAPTTPRDVDGAMTLGSVSIPPYPSLSQSDARIYKRSDYNVDVELTQFKRYTMKDIGVVDKKIERLEYYTSLSLLEASAKNLIIKDSTGADRFKNGFLVEPFKGFSIADTQSPEFKAGIDLKIQEMAPPISRTYVDLVYDANTSTNTSKIGNLITLASSNTAYITQPFASKYRNCVENIIYTWAGTISLLPEGDSRIDTTVAPDIISNLDLSGVTNLINTLPSIIGTERIVSTGVIGVNETFNIATGQRDIFTTSVSNTIRNDIDFSASTIQSSFNFGEVVQDISIQPFIRPQRVQFIARGLKPNARVYAYFEDINVTAFVRRTDQNFSNPSSILTVDSTGILYGYFDIPQNTFKTGERTFKLVDVDNLITGSDSITTRASAIFTASNIAITKVRNVLNTRLPQVSINTVQVSNTFTQTTQQTILTPVVDPIAQSFLINEPTSTPTIMISSIDVFFQSKDNTLGIELQVREVENGFPTTKIVPFGTKYLPASSVNVSADASVATTFTFDSPLILSSGKEYCFVVMPIGNNQNYNIWVGEIGGTDITNGNPIYTNNFTGVMFTSSTNRVWTPFQKEDIKFVLNRKDFNNLNGTINYNNGDVEYLSVNNSRGSFIPSERVLLSNGNIAITSNATVSTTSNILSVGNTSINAQTAFVNNNLVYISSNNGTLTDVRAVVSRPNTTHIILSSNCSFADSNASVGYIVSNGALSSTVEYFNSAEGKLYLNNSTANTTINYNTFVTVSSNSILIGLESRSRANLVSVDSMHYSTVIPQLSYLAPAGTTARLTFAGTANSAFVVDSVNVPVTADIETFFTDRERKVMSKSLEMQHAAGAKSLKVSIPITSEQSKVSPVFDDIKSDVLIIKNQIGNNNSLTLETNPSGGDAPTKYISKRVILADGQDAEDLTVFLSAYKPANTDIKVYCKLLNAGDSEGIDSKFWTLMEQKTSSAVVSSRVTRDDFKEYQYVLPTGNNATTTKTAFLNTNNGNVVRYYGASGSIFDGYKSFSIKIVLVSEEGTHLVPRVSDMRAIALQA